MTTTASPYLLTAEYDAETAAARALIDHLAALTFTDRTGKTFQFKKAFYEWPDSEDQMQLPCVSIVPSDFPIDPGSAGNMPYELDGSRTPATGDGHYLVRGPNKRGTMQIDVWASNKPMRQAIILGIEGELLGGATDNMYGLRLNMGAYYYGITAMYSLKTTSKKDTSEEATKRHRRVMFLIDTIIPTVTPKAAKEFKPRIQLEVDNVPVTTIL